MNTQMAAFAFGCLLLLVAILGGGFELKMLKVPKVGRASRWVACLFGMFFVAIAVRPDIFASKHDGSPAGPKPPISSPPGSEGKGTTKPADPPQVEPPPQPPPSSTEAGQQPTTRTGPSIATSDKTGKRLSWKERRRNWWNRLKGDRP